MDINGGFNGLIGFNGFQWVLNGGFNGGFKWISTAMFDPQSVHI